MRRSPNPLLPAAAVESNALISVALEAPSPRAEGVERLISSSALQRSTEQAPLTTTTKPLEQPPVQENVRTFSANPSSLKSEPQCARETKGERDDSKRTKFTQADPARSIPLTTAVELSSSQHSLPAPISIDNTKISPESDAICETSSGERKSEIFVARGDRSSKFNRGALESVKTPATVDTTVVHEGLSTSELECKESVSPLDSPIEASSIAAVPEPGEEKSSSVPQSTSDVSLVETPSSTLISPVAVSNKPEPAAVNDTNETIPVNAAAAPKVAARKSTPNRKWTPYTPWEHSTAFQEQVSKDAASHIGYLTRKCVDMIFASKNGCIEINDCAAALQVPKRRVYDITTVLEGIGLIEKLSKNTLAWKGSDTILGSAMDPAASEKIQEIRKDISALMKEESQLDFWISILQTMNTKFRSIDTTSIVEGLFHSNAKNDATKMQVEGTRNETQALVAVHAPYDCLVHVPPTTYSGVEHLYVGTRAGLEAFGSGNKRTAHTVLSRKGIKLPRKDDKIHVYLIPTYFNEDEKRLKPLEARMLSGDHVVRADQADAELTS